MSIATNKINHNYSKSRWNLAYYGRFSIYVESSCDLMQPRPCSSSRLEKATISQLQCTNSRLYQISRLVVKHILYFYTPWMDFFITCCYTYFLDSNWIWRIWWNDTKGKEDFFSRFVWHRCRCIISTDFPPYRISYSFAMKQTVDLFNARTKVINHISMNY